MFVDNHKHNLLKYLGVMCKPTLFKRDSYILECKMVIVLPSEIETSSRT